MVAPFKVVLCRRAQAVRLEVAQVGEGRAGWVQAQVKGRERAGVQ